MKLRFVSTVVLSAALTIVPQFAWQLWGTDLLASDIQKQTVKQIVGTGTPKMGTPISEGTPTRFDSTDVQVGDILGVIQIPRFGDDWSFTIRHGSDLESILDQGNFGHYLNTEFPGEKGNFAMAAHRLTFGAPMRDVDKLAIGDEIIVRTSDTYFVYAVDTSVIVPPTASGYLADRDDDSRILTITTCHPPYTSTDRWIIQASLSYWAPVEEGSSIVTEDIDRVVEPLFTNEAARIIIGVFSSIILVILFILPEIRNSSKGDSVEDY